MCERTQHTLPFPNTNSAPGLWFTRTSALATLVWRTPRMENDFDNEAASFVLIKYHRRLCSKYRELRQVSLVQKSIQSFIAHTSPLKTSQGKEHGRAWLVHSFLPSKRKDSSSGEECSPKCGPWTDPGYTLSVTILGWVEKVRESI